jgi:hypothetical protein
MLSPVTKDFNPEIRDDPDAPWTEVARDPGVIEVIVKRPPVQFIFGQEKKMKSPHK